MENLRIYKTMQELIEKNTSFAVATIVKAEGSSPGKVGAKMLVDENREVIGSIGGGCAESIVIEEAIKILNTGESKLLQLKLEDEEKGGIGMLCGGTMEVFIEPIRLSPKLVIIGSGHLAKSICRLGKFLDFTVVVIDPFAEKEDFSEADEVVSASETEALGKVKLDPNSHIVIVTRHKYDEQALRSVLDSKAAYIGLVGSKNRINLIFNQLMSEGVPKEKLESIYAPIGLDIGAKTPAEIALSILSEIIKVKNAKTGQSLKEFIEI